MEKARVVLQGTPLYFMTTIDTISFNTGQHPSDSIFIPGEHVRTVIGLLRCEEIHLNQDCLPVLVVCSAGRYKE